MASDSTVCYWGYCVDTDVVCCIQSSFNESVKAKFYSISRYTKRISKGNGSWMFICYIKTASLWSCFIRQSLIWFIKYVLVCLIVFCSPSFQKLTMGSPFMLHIWLKAIGPKSLSDLLYFLDFFFPIIVRYLNMETLIKLNHLVSYEITWKPPISMLFHKKQDV